MFSFQLVRVCLRVRVHTAHMRVTVLMWEIFSRLPYTIKYSLYHLNIPSLSQLFIETEVNSESHMHWIFFPVRYLHRKYNFLWIWIIKIDFHFRLNICIVIGKRCGNDENFDCHLFQERYWCESEWRQQWIFGKQRNWTVCYYELLQEK